MGVCRCCGVKTVSCQLSRRCSALLLMLTGLEIPVSLPGGNANAGPISNLVFHKLWQLCFDDKLTKIRSAAGKRWQYNVHRDKWKISFQKSKSPHAGSKKAKQSNLWVSGWVALDSTLKWKTSFLKSYFRWQRAPGWTLLFIWLMKSETAH